MTGGFGTMDELFEVLTPIQIGKLEDFPIALMGGKFYGPGIEMIQKMVDAKTSTPPTETNSSSRTALRKSSIASRPRP